MRAVASVTLSFGLVAIPVKLYAATDASTAIRFKLMSRAGARVRQQYVADEPADRSADDGTEAEDPSPPAVSRSSAPGRPTPAPAPQLALLPSSARPLPVSRGMEPVTQIKAAARPSDDDDRHEEPPAEPGGHLERHEMVRGYEFEKGRFVLFTPDELKALQEASRDSIDIVAFIPEAAVDPIYYDKAYLVAPDKRGERTYALLLEALRTSARTALARWAWKGKEYVVQVRAADGGLVLQQLLYADEVRLPSVLDLQLPAVGQAELQLALKLIEQGSQEVYDPAQFVDEEKQRILAAVERKIAGGSVVSHRVREPARPSGQVIDLLDALRASLHPPPAQVASKSRPRQRAKVSSRN